MRYVTDTRLNMLESILRTIPDDENRSYALHLLNAIRDDIEQHYAEIQRPIRVSGIRRPEREQSE